MDRKTSEVAELNARLGGESGTAPQIQVQCKKSESLLNLLQSELLASEDERKQLEKSLKELRHMAVGFPSFPLIHIVKREGKETFVLEKSLHNIGSVLSRYLDAS